MTFAGHHLKVVMQPSESLLVGIARPFADGAIPSATPPVMAGTLMMPLGECIDAIDRAIILSELFLGDRYPLFSDRIENEKVPTLSL